MQRPLARLGLAVALAAAACARTGGGVTAGDDGLPRSWSYDVTVAPALDRLDVRLRFDGAPPEAVMLGDDGGLPTLGAPTDAAGRPLPAGAGRLLPAGGGRWTTSGLGDGAEVRYSVDLAALAQPGRRRHGGGAARRVGDDVLAASGLWLLRPVPRAADGTATVRFHLPPGVCVSAPWIPIPPSPRATRGPSGDPLASPDASSPSVGGLRPRWTFGDGVWRLPASSFAVRGTVAFVHEEPSAVEVPGGTLSVAVLPGARVATDAGIRRALREAAGAVAKLYGTFPVPRAQILVEPVPGRAPFPFGATQRGGGRAVHLLLGADASDDALRADWTPVHELTHLGMPWLGGGDGWMSEGFVTWYQEVLRGRAGQLDEREVWQRLVDGFDRGRRSATGRTLAEDSGDMDARHAYLPVYWGGAACALDLDVALRRASGGARSLDDAVRELHRRFATDTVETSAAACVAALDRWNGGTLVSETCARRLASTDASDVTPLLRDLGVVVEDGRVRLDDAAPLASVRRVIANE